VTGMRFGKIILAFGAILLFAGRPVLAQEPQPESSSKPAGPPNDDPKPKSPAKQKKDTATKNAADQPTWDPLRAEKDLEVGQYYMKKGDFDAAIDRFQDATEAKPGYAVPFKYLGEAQEKKGLKKQAIKSYQRYLDLYPHAEDATKIKKKLEKLWREVEKEKKG
jgi:tetratricopeptide (TPR) repeat protein